MHQRGELQIPVAQPGTQPQDSVVLLEVTQLGQPADVDERARCGEPELHQRNERVPAGEELRVLPVVGLERGRVSEGVCPHVVEVGGDHRAPASAARATYLRTVSPAPPCSAAQRTDSTII